jgi:myosin heavy subunit
VDGFKCDFNRVPFETRANVYLQLAKPIQDEVNALKSKINNLKSRLATAQHAASTKKEVFKMHSKEAKKLRSEIKRRRRSIEAMSRALAGKRQLYEKARKDVEEAAALLAEYTSILEEKKRKIVEQTELTAELSKYHASQTEVQKCRDDIKMHEGKLKELDLKYRAQLNAARRLFNEKAREVMKAVGFKGFKSIKVDDNFKTVVDEEGGCRREIETLSTSEAVTMAILLALAAKKAYLPEFPLFIVDTVTTHYQPPKYKRVIEYLAEQVPYLIVTALSPREDEPIKIVHSWP